MSKLSRGESKETLLILKLRGGGDPKKLLMSQLGEGEQPQKLMSKVGGGEMEPKQGKLLMSKLQFLAWCLAATSVLASIWFDFHVIITPSL